MKKRNWFWLLAILSSACIFGACSKNSGNTGEPDSGNSNSNSSIGGSEQPESPDDGSSSTPEKELREVDILACSLDSRYYVGDEATVENASLDYDGALLSDYFEIVLPDGSKQTDAKLDFVSAGTYTVTFFVELYLENIYGVWEIEVLDWQESYSQLDVVSIECNDECYLGNTFIAPQTAIVDYFGVQKEASFTAIEKPDGTVVEENATRFDKSGVYNLVYEITVGNRVFTAKKAIEIDYQCYELSGEKSEREYSYSRMDLVLAEGEELIVNKSVNLNEMGKNDTLVSLRLKPAEANASQGVPDAMIFYVKLTDIYDANNYVLIQLDKRFIDPGYREWADGVSYLRAGSAEQTLGGINSLGNLATTGSEARFSMVSNPAGQTLTLSFDYATRQVHVKEGINGTLVTDLDDTKYYNSNFDTTLWQGFTTGEVYLSIYAEDYRSEDKKARIELLDVCGFGTLNYKTVEFEDGIARGIYEIGSEFDLDSKQLSFCGTAYSSTVAAITKPDGTLVENPTELTFDQLGVYKIVFTADMNGETISATYSAQVIKTEIVYSKPILNEYEKGSVLVIPEGTCVLGEQIIVASVQAKDPNGEEILLDGNQLTLNEIGKYLITYSVEVSGRTVEKILELNSVSKVAFATGEKATSTTMVDDKNHLHLSIAMGDKVTVNKVFDWSNVEESAKESTYMMMLLYFEDMLAADYTNRDLVVRITNEEDINNWLEIKYNFYPASTALPAQMVAYVTYFDNGETTTQTHWFNKFAGSDNTYLKDSAIIFGFDGIFDKAHDQATQPEDRAQGVMLFDDFFKKGVVTFSSTSGISFTVGYLNANRDWVEQTEEPVVEAEINLAKPLLNEYAQNSTVVLPNATYLLNNQTLSATLLVKAPDGTDVVVTDNSFVASQLGAYTLNYTALINGQECVKVYTINSVAAVSYASGADAGTTTQKNASNGLLTTTIAAGDTLTVNHVMDWSDKTNYQGLVLYAVNFTEMTCEEYKTKDITFRLTNAEDASQYIEFVIEFFNDANNVNHIVVNTKLYGGLTFADGTTTMRQWMGRYAGSDNPITSKDDFMWISTNGLYHWHVGNNGNHVQMPIKDMFTTGVLTVTSESGIEVEFNYLGGSTRAW